MSDFLAACAAGYTKNQKRSEEMPRVAAGSVGNPQLSTNYFESSKRSVLLINNM